MPIFYYTAKKKNAQTVEGQVFADGKDEAIEKINELGLLPVKIEDKQEVSQSYDVQEQKISSKELYSFSKQLSGLLKAGIPLLRGLQIIEKQLSNSYLRKVVNEIAMNINDGRPFSDSLEEYPNVFPFLYSSMVRAGEESGQLKEMLLSVAEYYKKQADINSKVRSALVYPMIMFGLGIVTVVFMMIVVMPKITKLFETMQTTLPIPTVIVLKLGEIIQAGWIVILLGATIGGVVLVKWLKSKKGHQAMSRFVLTVPFLKNFILKVEMARFSRTMELLLQSGVTILKALELAIPLVDNDVIKEALIKCQEELTAGGSFGESLKQTQVIPDMLGDLIAVGEESGMLADALGDVADSYQEETEENIKVMTTLIEPIMIVVVGASIAFIVFAILMPIFQMDVFS